MKKKIILLAIASTMAIGTIIGGAMAAYQASTDTRKTVTTTAVDIKLEIEGAGEIDKDGNLSFESSDIKDGIVDERVHAVNKGGRDVYVRISINKAWYDGEDKLFERNGKEIDSRQIGIQMINQEDWLIQDKDLTDGNGEEVYFYYRRPLKAGEPTSDIMDAFALLKTVNENTNHYSGLQAKIKFDADAIQTTAAKDAMLAEWGVDVTFDASGNLISLKDQ